MNDKEVSVTAGAQKIATSHLRRKAVLYVRQSTMRQVFENTESTKRQYALRDRAVALGWSREEIVVIDGDLGETATEAGGREGFEKLVTEVGMGRCGIVLGLEVSRLARNSSDWHRLLELCALSDTLILDEDGLYDPKNFNDRLLLGMKGQMSEAEIHVMRMRLRGGLLNKARRAELKLRLPVGLVYDAHDQVRLDPDRQVRDTVRLLFDTFRRVGSAQGVVRAFREQSILFPRRLVSGPRKGEAVWSKLTSDRVLQALHNPRYAGAFAYGRKRSRRLLNGRITSTTVPQDEWHTLAPNAHEGYISWDEFQDNQRTLLENAQTHGKERKKSPPREGPALLQGIVVCGVCGDRMTVSYRKRREGRLLPQYRCQRRSIQNAVRACQDIHGASIDAAVAALLLDMVTPVALEVALTVQQEIQSRLDEADRLRHAQVERARYQADLAQQRFMQVDPNNRLVADALEAQWNDKLRALTQAQEQYERQRAADRAALDDGQRARVLALATDFPKLWRDPKTPQRERKRMVRLLVEDVTLARGEHIAVHIRFKGGAARSLKLPLPLPARAHWTTSPEVVSEIDRLLDSHTESEIVDRLNANGYRPGRGKLFNRSIVLHLRRRYKLRSRYDRLRAAGFMTIEEIARRFDVSINTARSWRRQGLLAAHRVDGKQFLFEPPGKGAPIIC